MSSTIRIVGRGPWRQSVPGAIADPDTRAQLLRVGMARWMAGQLERTVAVELHDGDQERVVVFLGTHAAAMPKAR